MSIQDLLQKDVKQVAGPNINLVVSSLPSDYTVEVRLSFLFSFYSIYFVFFFLIRNLLDC